MLSCGNPGLCMILKLRSSCESKKKRINIGTCGDFSITVSVKLWTDGVVVLSRKTSY